MLISLLAILAIAATTAVSDAIADAPIVLEGPSTLELALIGAGVLVVYAVASRSIGRRRLSTSTAAATNQLTIASTQTATVEVAEEHGPSRGAA